MTCREKERKARVWLLSSVYDNSQWNRSALVLFTLLLFPHPEAGFVPSLIIDGVPMWKHSFITKDCFFSSSPSFICKQQDRKILHCQECEIGIAIKWICLAKKETTLKKHVYNKYCGRSPFPPKWVMSFIDGLFS